VVGISSPSEQDPEVPSLGAGSEGPGQGCSPKGCLQGPSVSTTPIIVDNAQREPNSPPRPRARPPLVRHTVQGKSQDEISKLVRNDFAGLGSMTFGTATRGGLLNAVHMPEDDRWTLVDPPHAWGTAETINNLVTTIDAVTDQFPGSPRLFIGDISRREGGYLSPHLSHQSGRDVDIGYFYQTNAAWYVRATPQNLDRPRTWALIRTFIARTDVHYIFIDRRVQHLLREYAEKIGEDSAWLESIFHGTATEPPIILHEPGHDTHFHVRFYNPVAEDTGRRAYGALLQQHKLAPMHYTINHRVKKGDTLIGLAKHYGVTVAAIMKANNLKKKALREDRTYLIPRDGAAGPAEPAPCPPRRVPPARPPTGAIASR
jgi:murein endopeptidase